MLDPLYNGMGIRARVCVSPLSSCLLFLWFHSITARKPSIDTRRLCAKYARSQPGMHAMHNARLQKTTLNGVEKKSELFLFFKYLDFLDKLSKINTISSIIVVRFS